MKKTLLILLAVLMLFAAAGCGSSADSSPKAVVTQFFDAIEKANTQDFMECLSKADIDAVKSQEGLSDSDILQQLSQLVQDASKGMKDQGIQLSKLAITQPEDYKSLDSATVPVDFQGDVQKINVVKEDGKWYVDLDSMGGLF